MDSLALTLSAGAHSLSAAGISSNLVDFLNSSGFFLFGSNFPLEIKWNLRVGFTNPLSSPQRFRVTSFLQFLFGCILQCRFCDFAHPSSRQFLPFFAETGHQRGKWWLSLGLAAGSHLFKGQSCGWEWSKTFWKWIRYRRERTYWYYYRVKTPYRSRIYRKTGSHCGISASLPQNRQFHTSSQGPFLSSADTARKSWCSEAESAPVTRNSVVLSLSSASQPLFLVSISG